MQAKKKKANGNKRILYTILSIVLLFLLAAGIKIYEDVFAGNVNVGKGKTAYLYYHTNKTFDENFELIEASGLMHNTGALKRLIGIAGYSELLRPGRYKVSHGTSNLELMRMLVSGRQEPLDVTFRYAERKSDLVSFWGQQLEADSSQLLEILDNPVTADSLGLDNENIITVFIPNTYNFYWNTSAAKLFERIVKEYRLFWDEERLKKAAAAGLSKAEVSVLASIVQKETFRKEEMPVVAGVYLNRLKRGMPLQADPTIIYAMNDKSIRRVYGEMLDVKSPYNTYRLKGLPPGPICVPSVQAIDAVLNHGQHKYIYFCAKEDFSGYHNFAASFAQHQVNARKYQRALNAKGIR